MDLTVADPYDSQPWDFTLKEKKEQSGRALEIEKAVDTGRKPPVHRLQPDAGVQQAKVDRMGKGKADDGGKGSLGILYPFVSNSIGRGKAIPSRAPRQRHIMERRVDGRIDGEARGPHGQRRYVPIWDEAEGY